MKMSSKSEFTRIYSTDVFLRHCEFNKNEICSKTLPQFALVCARFVGGEWHKLGLAVTDCVWPVASGEMRFRNRLISLSANARELKAAHSLFVR